MVRVTDCKTEGAGSIPDGIAAVFALIRPLLKNLKRFFTRTFYGFSGRVPPRTISKGFHLESLKVPAERSAEEPFKVLLRTFFSNSVVIADALSQCEAAAMEVKRLYFIDILELLIKYVLVHTIFLRPRNWDKYCTKRQKRDFY